MRIYGKEVPPEKPLTAGELRTWLNARAERDQNFDDHLVHMLFMEKDEDADGAAYATHVEVDAFDTVEVGTDEEPGAPIFVVSLMHWPSRDKKTGGEGK